MSGIDSAGITDLYIRDYAAMGADFDPSDVSSFSVPFDVKKDSFNILYSEDVIKKEIENQLAIVDIAYIGQALSIEAVMQNANASRLMTALGLDAADVVDKSGESPKRYQFDVGGNRATKWYNFIMRRRQSQDADLFTGYLLHKGTILVNGGMPMGRGQFTEVPFKIECVCMESGSYAGHLARYWQDYEAATPAITSIDPTAGSVADVVAIEGTGFGESQGTGVVTFNDAKDSIVYHYWSDTMIVCKVPAAATTGDVTVTNNAGNTSAGESFTIS